MSFMKSKDLASYRPYAFKESEIIIAKGLSVLLPALTGILPIPAYFLALYIRLAPSLWLGLPLMLMSLALLFVSVALVMVVGVHFLAQTALFRKYQSIFSNVMIGIGVLTPLIFVFFLQSTSRGIGDQTKEIPPLLYPIHLFTNSSGAFFDRSHPRSARLDNSNSFLALHDQKEGFSSFL